MRRVVVPLLVAALLAGCGGARAVPAADLAGLSVQIRQPRAEWADRVVQLRVRNAGAVDLTVRTGELVTGYVEGAATSDPADSREVPAGWYRDFPVPLGAPICGAGADAAASVTLHVADGAGRVADLTLAPTDPQGHLARINGEDCAAAAVAAGARLTLGPDVVVEDRGGALVGLVELTAEPRPGGPVVRVTEIEGTVLLAPLTGTSWSPAELATPISRRVTVRLDFRPSRCDPHAVAEDKRGTFLGVHASVDGVAQPVFYLAVPDHVLGAVHDFIGRACGW